MNTPFRDKKRPTYCNPYGLNGKSDVNCDISDSTLPFPDMLPFLTESNNLPVETHNGQAKESISTYSIDIKNDYVGQLYYDWSVSAGAEILQPYDIYSKKIQVKTNSATDVSFDVTCNVTDNDRVESVTQNYTHQRINGENFLVLTSITETQSGVCTFDTNKTCIATSSYQLNHTNGDKFEWFVDNGNIVEGQGTDAISVETTGNTNIPINILCKVSNSVSFGDISDNFVHNRTENVIPDVIITDIVAISSGTCSFETTSFCIAESSYSVSGSGFTGIYWELIPQDGVEMIGSPTDDIITVRSTSGEDTTFTLKVKASNSVYETEFEKNFTHIRTEIVIEHPIITSIDELSAGTCEWYQTTCLASGEYIVNHLHGTNFYWQVVGNAYVSNGQGTDTVTISSDSDKNEPFTLKCRVNNSRFETNSQANFIHTRQEVDDIVSIGSLVEAVSGSCGYGEGSTCLALSEYQISGSDYASIVWEVIGANIQDGQGTENLIVASTGNVDSTFMVRVTLIGNYGKELTKYGYYTHSRELTLETIDATIIYDINNIAEEFTA